MLVPSKGCCAYTSIVVLQGEAFQIAGKVNIHVQQTLEPDLNVLSGFGIGSELDDPLSGVLVSAFHVSTQGFKGLVDLAAYFRWIIEDLCEVRAVDRFGMVSQGPGNIRVRFLDIAKPAFRFAFSDNGFEIVSVTHHKVFDIEFFQNRQQFF